MRKLVLISILLIVPMTIMSCNLMPAKKSVPIELIAFNSLTDEEKDLIPVSPKDSIVMKVVVNDENKPFIDENYSKNQVYAVTFNNTGTDSSGDLTVFIDLDKVNVVGKGFLRKKV